MPIPNSIPTIVETAFNADQLMSMRQALDESRLVMSGRIHRANSIGFLTLSVMDQSALMHSAIRAFLDSGAHDFAIEQFPEGYCFLLPHCSFRYHDPLLAKSHLGLHFDANFIGLGAKAINVWVPLTDIEGDVPGLTFLGPKVDPIVLYKEWRRNRDALVTERGADDIGLNIFFDRDDIKATFAEFGDEAFDTPRLKAGGFISFHQLVLHGTQVLDRVSKPRGSIEFRIASRSALPDAYRNRSLPIAILQTDERSNRSVKIVESGDLAMANSHTA